MDDLSAKILGQIHPELAWQPRATWRDRRSAETRLALIEATIDCLSRVGYAQTSIRAIADAVGIGHAMIRHHYTSKLNLIAVAIDFAFYKRIETYALEVQKLTAEERANALVGTELFWETLKTPEYAACLELEVVSRTDQELAEVYVPRARRFERIWRERIITLHPEWQIAIETYQLAADFGWALFEGAMLKRDIWNDEARQHNLRRLYIEVAKLVRDGRLNLTHSQTPVAAHAARVPRRRGRTKT